VLRQELLHDLGVPLVHLAAEGLDVKMFGHDVVAKKEGGPSSPPASHEQAVLVQQFRCNLPQNTAGRNCFLARECASAADQPSQSLLHVAA
jgi:hypothetical protein